jgi:hypothetical protein
VYDKDGVFSIPRESYWGFYNDVWQMFDSRFNAWSTELLEYFESVDYRLTKKIYSADFEPLIEIKYPFFHGKPREDVYVYGNDCTVITFTNSESYSPSIELPEKFIPEEFDKTIESYTGKKVLFRHKMFVNPVYLYFTAIERGASEFSVYSYTDYSSVGSLDGGGFLELKFSLPTDVKYDTAEPIWAGGGGGSGECQFIIKLTSGSDVTYISYNNFHYTDKLLDFKYAGIVSDYELANLAASYPEVFMVDWYHEAEYLYATFTGNARLDSVNEVIEYICYVFL